MNNAAHLGKSLGSTDDDPARHMADALTYLSRVAVDAGYPAVALDILAVRDKLDSIASAEEAARCRAGTA